MQDIIYPRVLCDENGTAVEGFSQLVDEGYKTFIELFNQSVIEGKYQRFGSKVPKKDKKLKIDDFVIVSLTADKPKYGIIAGFESEHRIKVLLLTRRYKNGSGQVGHQIIDVNNSVHIYRP